MSLPKFASFQTTAIHVGQDPDSVTGAVIPALSLSTTFKQKSPGQHTGFEYGRSGNPTRCGFEAQIAGVEGAKYGMAFASGLAATTTVLSMLDSGDHIVCEEDLYGGTGRLLNKIMSHHGLVTTMVDFTRPADIEAAIQPGKTKLLWMETPTNPLLKVVDIAAVAVVAKKHNVIFVVDNTFLSPYFQRPLSLGADVVMHSISKYINGHSDVIGGVLATSNEDLHTKLKFLQNAVGAILSPFDSFLASRGLKTLAIRMREHEKNAFAVARFLESHPKIEKVIYPGLPSHPQHEVAKKQQTGFGGMVTVVLKGGLEPSRTFLERLHVFTLAESLGGIESLAEHPAIMTHASVPAEHRAKLGISDGLVRLSVGIEDEADLIADLTNALDGI